MVRRTATGVVLALAVLVGHASSPARADEERVDLRPEFERWKLPRKRQGKRNTCSVCTTVGAMEYALSKKYDLAYPLSAEFLNWACNQVIRNETHDRGQFFHDLLRGLKRFGICREAEMPYAAKFYPEYEPSERALKSAKAIKGLKLKAYWIKPNDGKVGITDEHLAEIKKTLRKGWPVCGGSSHSVLLVGFEDDASAPGGGRFFVRDSGGGNQRAMTYAEAKSRLCDLIWYGVPLS